VISNSKEGTVKADREKDMLNNAIIDLAQYRKKVEPKKRTTKGNKGTIYSRTKKLWVDFMSIGFENCPTIGVQY